MTPYPLHTTPYNDPSDHHLQHSTQSTRESMYTYYRGTQGTTTYSTTLSNPVHMLSTTLSNPDMAPGTPRAVPIADIRYGTEHKSIIT